MKTANDITLERPNAADPEVLDRPTRRQFSADYERRILAECDVAPPGAVGAILRREGLYSSHLCDWRAARDHAQTAALSPKKRGPKAEPKSAHERENVRLRRELERTQKKLERAELVMFVRKLPEPPALPTAVWINPPKQLFAPSPEEPPVVQ